MKNLVNTVKRINLVTLTGLLFGTIIMVSLSSCNNKKEVDATEPISIEVSLDRNKNVEAETEWLPLTDSLDIQVSREGSRRGYEYSITLIRYTLSPKKESLRKDVFVSVYFTNGESKTIHQQRASFSEGELDYISFSIEPVGFEGKTIESIHVYQINEQGGLGQSTDIEATYKIGEVLEDMIEACNEFKEKQNKYK
tara:strand:+ start:1634 stop:2221 length:588 start_codon:yes stop_codon:yes gene_type:complete